MTEFKPGDKVCVPHADPQVGGLVLATYVQHGGPEDLVHFDEPGANEGKGYDHQGHWIRYDDHDDDLPTLVAWDKIRPAKDGAC